jgi:hypothetical protein
MSEVANKIDGVWVMERMVKATVQPTRKQHKPCPLPLM